MRAQIYDTAISKLTTGWYREVLDRVGTDVDVLDVGIGTGTALLGNAEHLVASDVRVLGIDINEAYIRRCQKSITDVGLSTHVEAKVQSVYDHTDGPYDVVYFSASFMLLPDPVEALRHVCTLLKPHGTIYFTQTFEERRTALMEHIKPLLKRITTIDFGRVTYEDDFVAVLAEADLEVLEMSEMGRKGPRTFRLVAGRPAPIESAPST